MQILRFRALIVAAAVSLIYFLMVRYTPIKPRGDGLRAVFLVLGLWGVFSYWKPVREALLAQPAALNAYGSLTGQHLYAMAVFLLCWAVVTNTAWGLFWRLAGQPAYLINNPFFDFWVVLGIVAMIIIVSVPNLFGKGVPPRDKVQLGALWAFTFVFVAWLTIERPDLEWLAVKIRPLVDYGYEYDSDMTP